MSCPNCDAMRDEIAYLKGELGLRVEAEALGRIARAFTLAPQAAALLAMLYQANGRPVTHYQLREQIAREAHDERNLISVYICRIRHVLGREAVENLRGRGYGLSTEALARVASVIGAARK